MNGDARRQEILKLLTNAKREISASWLASNFNVSRQVIVGDIALLRALGHIITALPKGYVIEYNDDVYKSYQIIVKHSPEDTRLELEALVKCNLVVLDVSINHPTYGLIRGNLNIKSLIDIDSFLKNEPNMLSTLTDGIHIHTLLYKDENDLNNGINALKELGFVYFD